jgi:hypothetical protein
MMFEWKLTEDVRGEMMMVQNKQQKSVFLELVDGTAGNGLGLKFFWRTDVRMVICIEYQCAKVTDIGRICQMLGSAMMGAVAATSS